MVDSNAISGQDGKTITCSNDDVSKTSDDRVVCDEHLLGDPMFDHPHWNFLRDVIDSDCHGTIITSHQSAYNDGVQFGPKYSPSFREDLAQNYTPKRKTRNKNAKPTTTVQDTPRISCRDESRPNDRNGDSLSSFHPGDQHKNEGHQCTTGDRLYNIREEMSQQGLTVKDVNPDGNCFFAAVVDQLRVRGDFSHTVKSLRDAAVNYLRKDPNQDDGTPLQEFISDEHDSSWEGYLTRQSRDGVWADHIIMKSISNVLQQRLVIHSFTQSSPTPNITTIDPVNIREGNSDLNTNEAVNCKDSRGNVDKKRTDTQVEDVHNILGAKVSKKNCVRNKEEIERIANGEENAATSHTQYMRNSSNKIAEISDKDLLLGHYISVYVALTGLKDFIKDHHCTPSVSSYLNTSAELTDTEQVSMVKEQRDSLPEDHLNFLIDYIKNGHFLETSSYMKNNHFTLPHQLNKLYTCLGVGDRHNDIESYLIIDPLTTQWSCVDEYGMLLIWYLVYPNDTLVTKRENVKGMKQLIPDESGSQLGYLKLRPKHPALWKCSLVEENGNLFLKHLQLKQALKNQTGAPKILSFKCDWPEEASEAKERLLKCDVRSPEGNYHNIEDAVRVVPYYSKNTQNSNTECLKWKYSFSIVEYILCNHVITSDARFCFKIVSHFLKFIFNYSQIASRQILKATFFYVCDDLDIGKNQPTFLEIFSSYMQKLQIFLRDSVIPDFFLRSVNLIEDVNKELCRWHYERISAVNNNLLVYIFMFLDQRGLMDHFGLSRCFDSLLYNAHHEEKQTDHCFTKLSIMEAREWAITPGLTHNFQKSSFPIESITMKDYPGTLECEHDFFTDYVVNLYKEILDDIPLQEKWLYAFYLEYWSGKSFLDFVCEKQNCIKIQEYIGESAVQILLSDRLGKLRNQNILLPIEITKQEGVASFAVQFVNCLRFQFFGQSVVDACVASIHFFLNQHTDILLTNFTQSDNYNFDKLAGLKKTIYFLFELFSILYHLYNTRGCVYEIAD